MAEWQYSSMSQWQTAIWEGVQQYGRMADCSSMAEWQNGRMAVQQYGTLTE